jgi:hypothetical protein
MKKILLLLTVLASTNMLYAQCVPNAKTAPGKGYIIPDSATNMVHACAGLPYSETFYIKAFKDTTISITQGKTDSFVINLSPAALGIPSYLNVASVPATRAATATNNYPHLVIKGDSLACIVISGTVPGTATAGTTNLNIEFKAFLGVFIGGFKVTDTVLAGSYNDYQYIIDPPGTGACLLSVNSINKNLTQVSLAPNPVQQQATLSIQANKAEDVSIAIVNSLGIVISKQATKLNAGDNYIPLNTSALSHGLYLYRVINNAGATIEGKFVK